MKVCEDYRISHSHYLGGPNLWTPEDRAKVAAYREWAADTCPHCGTRPEWWDPKRGGHRHALIADLDVCQGCARKKELEEQSHDIKGAHVYLRQNPEVFPDAATDADRAEWEELSDA